MLMVAAKFAAVLAQQARHASLAAGLTGIERYEDFQIPSLAEGWDQAVARTARRRVSTALLALELSDTRNGVIGWLDPPNVPLHGTQKLAKTKLARRLLKLLT